MYLHRLSGRKTCEFLLRRGHVWKGKTMLMRWLPSAPKRPGVDPTKRVLYVGTFASSHLSKSAVERNRMRRRCREAIRLTVQDLHGDLRTPVQLLCTPRSDSLHSPFSALLTDAKAFLSQVESWPPPPPRTPHRG